MTYRFNIRKLGYAAAGAAFGVALLGNAVFAQNAVKMGHAMPVDHPQSRSIEKFAELADKYTDGRVKIQIYAGGTLGGDDKMLQATQAGTQEIYYGGIEPLSGRVKEIQIFSFPFIFDNMDEVDYVYYGPVGNKVFELMKPLNLVGLGWGEVGFRQLSNNKRPVKTAEDMKGLKVRVVQNTFALEMWKAMGVNATPMSFAEVFTALETGALDGQENPLIHMNANKMFEVQKYVTITNHVYTPSALLVSSKYWDTLKPEDQEGLRKAATEAMKFHRQVMTEADKEVRVTLKEKGMTIDTMPPEEIAKLREMVKPVVEKFVPVVGADFAKMFYAEVEKAKKETKK